MTSTRISRREFLQLGAGATAGVALVGSGMATFLAKEARASSPTLAPFVDELPIPPVLTENNLTLTIQPTTQKFHSALPETKVWGYTDLGSLRPYNGYLGPTIEAVKGTPTRVSYVNNLPLEHLFPVPTLPQVREANQQMDVSQAAMDTRILTHLHGGTSQIRPTATLTPPRTSSSAARPRQPTIKTTRKLRISGTTTTP